ncbi:MAG TPA: transcriptional repressor LexA [Actinobacteria bacterium]|nr:transcriptional repressor LexA [Actinomycetes bacterium]HEX21171.1 transcriptional repressor LexA [Actinomycetota bacterium]
MNQHSLSKRRQQIMCFIKEESRKNGYPPSVREIGAAVGLSSSSSVHSHLKILEDLGYIKRDPAKPRALKILQPVNGEPRRQFADSKTIPLVGRVAAGQPLLAEENIEEYLNIPAEIATDDSFVLQVNGESMIDAGILNGDYVVVRQQKTADNGDIVVALIGEDATVKRFYKEANRFRLEPENKTMSPIYADNVLILGKVIGLLRRL